MLALSVWLVISDVRVIGVKVASAVLQHHPAISSGGALPSKKYHLAVEDEIGRFRCRPMLALCPHLLQLGGGRAVQERFENLVSVPLAGSQFQSPLHFQICRLFTLLEESRIWRNKQPRIAPFDWQWSTAGPLCTCVHTAVRQSAALLPCNLQCKGTKTERSVSAERPNYRRPRLGASGRKITFSLRM
jgi:hypothetical protein